MGFLHTFLFFWLQRLNYTFLSICHCSKCIRFRPRVNALADFIVPNSCSCYASHAHPWKPSDKNYRAWCHTWSTEEGARVTGTSLGVYAGEGAMRCDKPQPLRRREELLMFVKFLVRGFCSQGSPREQMKFGATWTRRLENLAFIRILSSRRSCYCAGSFSHRNVTDYQFLKSCSFGVSLRLNEAIQLLLLPLTSEGRRAWFGTWFCGLWLLLQIKI